MPTTTNYGWTTPADTDLVKDGASAIRTLGNSIDSTLKTQIDAQIPDSIVTTKGDLISATAASTPARLAVGSNNQVLTADSTTATGLKWASPTTGVNPLFQITGSNYYVTPLTTTTSISAAGSQVGQNVTHFVPVFFPACTVDRLAYRTGNSWSATNVNYRIGIYNNGSNNVPSTVLLDAGTLQATAASTNYEVTVSQSIGTAGLYWLAINYQSGNTVTATNISFSNGVYLHSTSNQALSNALSAATPIKFFQESSVTGAFATVNTANLTAQTTNGPVIAARIN